MSDVINKSMTPAEWAMLLTLSVLWGGSFFFVGMSVKELPPFTIVLLRVGLAAAALYIILLAIGQKMPADRRIWTMFFQMGLLNNVVPFCLIVWGQTHIASGLASILNATTPVFTVVVAHYLTTDERMTGGRVVGVLAGFAGVVVMIGPEFLAGLSTHVFAQLAVLGAALAYALAGIYGRRFKAMGVDPIVSATGQVTASSVMLIPLVVLVEAPWSLAMPSIATWSALVGLAVLSTSLAYILYFRVLATAGATNILLVTFLIPVSAILLGAVFLDERLDPEHFAGMAIIGLGLAAIDGRPMARLLARTRPDSG